MITEIDVANLWRCVILQSVRDLYGVDDRLPYPYDDSYASWFIFDQDSHCSKICDTIRVDLDLIREEVLRCSSFSEFKNTEVYNDINCD